MVMEGSCMWRSWDHSQVQGPAPSIALHSGWDVAPRKDTKEKQQRKTAHGLCRKQTQALRGVMHLPLPGESAGHAQFLRHWIVTTRVGCHPPGKLTWDAVPRVFTGGYRHPLPRTDPNPRLPEKEAVVQQEPHCLCTRRRPREPCGSVKEWRGPPWDPSSQPPATGQACRQAFLKRAVSRLRCYFFSAQKPWGGGWGAAAIWAGPWFREVERRRGSAPGTSKIHNRTSFQNQRTLKFHKNLLV